jgi:hypothetical protein
LSYFASAASVADMSAQVSKALEASAIAASMGDAIPNAGDRFAVRMNVAGFSGQVGGSLGISYNVSNNARLSINYGQGATTSVVSGGVTFSLH